MGFFVQLMKCDEKSFTHKCVQQKKYSKCQGGGAMSPWDDKERQALFDTCKNRGTHFRRIKCFVML